MQKTETDKVEPLRVFNTMENLLTLESQPENPKPRPSILQMLFSKLDVSSKPRLSFFIAPFKSSQEEEKTRIAASGRARQLWAKLRNVIRAINTWKRVRHDVVLYGTHNYEFRKTHNIVS